MRATLTIVVLALFLTPTVILAQEFGFQITAQGTRSDNVRRAEANEVEEDIGSLELGLAAARNTGKLQFDMNGQYRELAYRNNTFEDEPIVALDLESFWEISADRFYWRLNDNFGQLTTDPFEATTPGNREGSNIFSTGPDFIVEFGRQLEVTLRARYADQYFEVSDADNSRLSGEIEFSRLLGQDRSIALFVLNDAISFDDQNLVDFDRRAVFLRYSSTLGASLLTFDVGVNEIDDGMDTSSGDILRLIVEREPSAVTSLRLEASKSFSDSGNRLAASNSGLGSIGSSQSTIANGDPLELIQSVFFMTRQLGRSALTVTLEYTEEDFLNDLDQDRRIRGAGLNFEFSVSNVSTIGIEGAFRGSDFKTISRKDDDLELGIYYKRRIGRSFSARIGYSDVQRRSSEAGRNYDEARILLSVTYSRGQLFTQE